MMLRRWGWALALCAAGCADGIPLLAPDLGATDLAIAPETDLNMSARDLAVPDLMPLPCANGVQDGDETGVDCGGGTCGPCDVGGGCLGDKDCKSQLCDGVVCEPKLLRFVAANDYPAGNGPQGIARLDWNGDGIDDLAVADHFDSNSPGTIQLLRGLPGGTFVAAGQIAVPQASWALAAGDFNGDKTSDLVVSSVSGGDMKPDAITLLLGDGKGGFLPSTTAKGSAHTLYFAVGDFDGDGHLDLATSGMTAAPVLLGDGQGNLTPAADGFSAGGPIAAADLDGDGKSDLATVVGEVAYVSLASGNGSFHSAVPYGSGVGGVALGDVDGDGLSDLVITDDLGLQTFLNLGQGQLDAPVDSGGAIMATGLLLADADGDGNLDAIVLDASGAAQVRLQTGKGQFGAPTQVLLHNFWDYLVAGDFNQDGKADFASSDSMAWQVRVYLAGAGGAPIAAPINLDGGKRSSIAVADSTATASPTSPAPSAGTSSACSSAPAKAGSGRRPFPTRPKAACFRSLPPISTARAGMSWCSSPAPAMEPGRSTSS